MKKIIFIILYVFITIDFFSQNVHTDICFKLDENMTGETHIYKARDYIELLPGFEYEAIGNKFFLAEIDPSIIVPVNYNEPIIPWSADLDVGSLPGQAGVNQIGAATYSIPIQLPVGTKGIVPEISIVYNSLSGDGLFGDKWTVAGFSVISRMPENFYFDDKIDPIDYDGNDKFALDGQRLIPIYSNNSVYTTEIETYTRIYPIGTSGQGPLLFKVVLQNGTELYYGNKENSRIQTTKQGNISINFWLVDSIIDVYGNYTAISYIERNGFFYPKEIRYTGNAEKSIKPYYKINFYYSERIDENILFIGGGKICKDLLVNKIKVSYNSNVLFTYKFKYDFFKKSKLKEIILYNSEREYLNSTKINWGEYDTDNIISLSSSYNPNNCNAVIPCQVNADGKTDLLIIGTYEDNNGTVHYTYNMHKGGDVDTIPDDFNILNEYYPYTYVGDFNGDGFDDFLQVKKHTEIINFSLKYVYDFEYHLLSNEFGMWDWIEKDLDPVIVPYGYNLKFYFGDINGDAKTDIIIKEKNSAHIYKMQGQKLDDYHLSEICNITNLDKYDYFDISDLNGDGGDEITILNVDETTYFTYTLASNSNQLELIFSGDNPQRQLYGFYDFNGDGIGDYLYSNGQRSYSIEYSTGNGPDNHTIDLPPNMTNIQGNRRKIGDYNGDGKMDIAIFYPFEDSYKVRIFYFNGYEVIEDEYISKTLIIFDETNEYFHNKTVDENGDGKSEVLGYYSGFLKLFTPNISDNSALVESITDGYNNTYKFEYKPLTNEDVYERTQYYPPFDQYAIYNNKLRDVILPVYVVSSFEYPNGIGNLTNTTEYFYRDAMLHLQGKGLLTFLKREETSQFDDGTIIKITNINGINLNYFFPFAISSFVEVDGEKVSEQIFSDTIITYGEYVFRNHISKIYKTDFLNNCSVNSAFIYDNYGNVTKSIIYDSIYKTISNLTYINTGPGAFNFQLETENITQRKDGEYDFTTSSSYEYYNTGNLKKETINPDNSEYVVVTEYFYDDFGNTYKVVMTPANMGIRTVSIEYDENGRFVKKATNELNFQTYYNYDQEYGYLLSETSINGLTTNYEYDEWGRLIKTILPDGNSISNDIVWDNEHNYLYKSITTNIDGTQQKTFYDRLQREIFFESTGFDGQKIISAQTFNDMGQLIRIVEPHFYNQDYQVVKYEYDSFGREKKVEYTGTGSTLSYNYGTFGSRTVEIDDNGRKSYTTTNCAGEVISASDIGGTITYNYYASGLAKNIIYNNDTIKFEYDLNGNKIKIEDPDAGIINYSYDALGNLIQQIDNSEYVFNMQYDILNRLTLKDGPEGITSYIYDSQPNGKGKISSISGFNGITQTFFYDELGRNYKTTENVDNEDYSYTSTYDNFGRVNTITYPGGFRIYNSYNENGFLDKIYKFGDNKPIWQLNQMDQVGNITQITLGNDLTTTYLYNTTSHLLEGIAVSNDVFAQSYDFHPKTGNLTFRTDYFANKTESFEYDNLDRLTIIKQNMIKVQTINYLPNGNIDNKSDIGQYTYSNIKPHAVDTVENQNNIISGLNQNISYNSFNRVEQISESFASKQTEPDLFELNFNYNSAYDRKKTELYINDELIETKYFFGLYEKEITNDGNIKEINYVTTPTGMSAVFITNSTKNNGSFIKECW